MDLTTCRTFEEELAPEMALGTISGEERAQALEHMTTCTRCRLLVEELSQVSDALLLVAPEAEPPVGFESRALLRTGPTTDRRRLPRHRLVAALAGVVVLAGAFAASLSAVVGGGGTEVASPAPRSPAVTGPAGVTYVKEALLLTRDHHQLGRVFAYPGRPGWIVMTVDDPQVNGPVVCKINTADGETFRVGTFHVTSGRATWGGPVPVDPGQMRSASLATQSGHLLATGSL